MTPPPAPSTLRRIGLPALLSVAFVIAGPAQAQSKDCPLTPDQLKKVFGIDFAPGQSDPAMGTGCRYNTKGGSLKNDTDFTVGLYTESLMGTAEAHRKMVIGPMHQYPAVAGDADKAVAVKHGGSVPPFPQIAYERGGKLVRLQVIGLNHEPDAKARDARIDQMNKKLLQLPRVP